MEYFKIRYFFKHCFIFTLLFILLAGCSNLEESSYSAQTDDEPILPKPILVFILAGQSNMVGQGQLANVPVGYLPLPDNIEFHALAKSLDRARFIKDRENAQMDDSNNYLKERVGNFGIELSFARNIADYYSESNLIFIKWAVGGTSQAQWSPDWKVTDFAESLPNAQRNRVMGSLFAQSIKDIKEITADKNVVFEGLLWFQGENDATNFEMASTYYKNIQKLIAGFREELNTPNLPVLIGNINPVTERHQFVSTVQKNIRRVALSDPNVKVVSADGISKRNDNVHYDEEGLIQLGERFADTWLGLKNNL